MNPKTIVTFSSSSSSSSRSSSWSEGESGSSSQEDTDSRFVDYRHHHQQPQPQTMPTTLISSALPMTMNDDKKSSTDYRRFSSASSSSDSFDQVRNQQEQAHDIRAGHDKEYESNDNPNKTGEATTLVPTDQERQLLILVLLAQVCALHDPTPRTFTIHVLELYEHGILDRESIQFLYDLGLVPSHVLSSTSIKPHNGDLTEHHKKQTDKKQATSSGNSQQPLPVVEYTKQTQHQEQQNEDKKVFLRQRSLEASAIRTSLELQEKKESDHKSNWKNDKQGKKGNHPVLLHGQSKSCEQHTRHPTSGNHKSQLSLHDVDDGEQEVLESEIPRWSVKDHPLSLSRYQREFEQVCLLSSGSFGSVYKAKNRLDERLYAIKRILFSAEGYSRASVQMMIREVHCLALCDHPNVVRYYTSWLEPSWMTGATNSTTHSAGLSIGTNSLSESRSSDESWIPNGIGNSPSMQLRGFGYFNSNDLQALEANLKLYAADQSEGTVDKFHALLTGNVEVSLSSPSGWKTSSNDYASWQEQREHQNRYDDSSRDDILFEDSVSKTAISKRDGSIDSKQIENSHRHHVEVLALRPQHNSGFYVNRNFVKERKKQTSHFASKYKYEISLFIQMQLCHSATLADWIRERNTNPQIEFRVEDPHVIDAVAQIFRQIVCGLHHVHQKGIIHRDLKPANIFVSTDDGELQFKIGDFGLSKWIQYLQKDVEIFPSKSNGNSMMSPRAKRQDNAKQLLLEYVSAKSSNHDSGQRCVPATTRGQTTNSSPTNLWDDPLTAGIGTASYAAPEQVDSTSYSSSADIFSVGLVLLELLCCFSTEHERLQTFHACRHHRKVPDVITQTFPVAAQTILSCTEYQPDKRPSAFELKHIDITVTRSNTNATTAFVAKSTLNNRKMSPSKMIMDHKDETDSGMNRENVEKIADEREQLRKKLLEYEIQCNKYKNEIDEKDAMIENLLQELNLMKLQMNQKPALHGDGCSNLGFS